MPGTSDKIWTEDIIVRSYDIDQYGRLSPLPLCDFLLDAAGNHAQKLGLSLHDLQSRQYTWVLSRMILKMDIYPVWRDTITIHTWPSGIEKLFALRDFEITDEQNRVIGAGVSAWLVIDVESRRPVRIKPFFETL
ncbi:MAG: hypothetical protein JW812_02105, partial [Alphaproteobacteria bacterium]|nr:hypothetical protein [Alphaproteobacteria bacterium]